MTDPYPRYRDSGVEWIGDIPQHWEFARIADIFAARSGGTPTTYDDSYWDGEIPWVSAKDMKALRIADSQDHITEAAVNESATTLVPPGTVLLVARSGILRHSLPVGRAEREVAINQDIKGLIPVHEVVAPLYFVYLLHGSQTALLTLWRQQGATVESLDFDAVRSTVCPLPPLDEQREIATFLDRETERIDALLTKKRQLIERLQEYRTALITRTVTRGLPPEAARTAGLDPSPRLKPSGVGWLGDVPEHWEVSPLSHLATKFGSGITPRGGATIYRETGVPFLRSQNIHFEGLRIQNVARIAPSLHRELAASHVEPGDVLLNITGASIGRVCAVPYDFSEGNVNQHVCIIRPDQSRLLPSLLAEILATPAMQREIQFEQSGASREGLTLQSIRSFEVVVPPLPEQIAMVEFLDSENGRIRGLSAAINSAMERLQEYRTALITAAVTGKIDVREAAA